MKTHQVVVENNNIKEERKKGERRGAGGGERKEGKRGKVVQTYTKDRLELCFIILGLYK